MSTTSIEWTRGDDGSPGRTWNPVTGCTKVSPGCDHCYAEGIARRFAGTAQFPRGFEVTLHPERLEAPLRWRKPSRVFVNSMSDLFHDDVPVEFIARVFAVMAATPRHTYQVLTKRHGSMRSLLGRPEFRRSVGDELLRLDIRGQVDGWSGAWPLPNVWLGVSVEDQKRAELRIPALLDTPAAVRFLSCEPLVGPVDLRTWMVVSETTLTMELPGLSWVIVGGESGPGARPMQLDWARSLVDQCQRTGVAVFVKQLGSAHGPRKGGDMSTWPPELRVREWPAVAS